MDRPIKKHIRISEIGTDTGLDEISEVIRASFATVAREYGLTASNCPGHPAFLETRKLTEMRDAGACFLGLTMADSLVGLVAVEIRDTICFIEKLAVLPECRHRGYGKMLMGVAEAYARERGCEKASIGIIDENEVLKDWYSAQGFSVTEIREHSHLPFRVCMMGKVLSA